MAHFPLNPEIAALAVDIPLPAGHGLSVPAHLDGYTFNYSLGEFHHHLFYANSSFHYGMSDRDFPDIDVEVSSPDREIVERALLLNIGQLYRTYNRLPSLRLPDQQPQAGYELVAVRPHIVTLRRPDGSLLPMELRETGGESSEGARYSYVADVPVSDLARSYAAADARPSLASYL